MKLNEILDYNTDKHEQLLRVINQLEDELVRSMGFTKVELSILPARPWNNSTGHMTLHGYITPEPASDEDPEVLERLELIGRFLRRRLAQHAVVIGEMLGCFMEAPSEERYTPDFNITATFEADKVPTP